MFQPPLRWRAFNAIYLTFLTVLTLAPFDFRLAAFSANRWGIGTSASDFLLNVIAFIPLGTILTIWLVARRWGSLRGWGWVTLGSGAISTGVECAQLFLACRHPALADVAANALGGGLGFWLATLLREQPGLGMRLRRPFIIAALILYIVTVGGICFWLLNLGQLRGWDDDYPLLVGNEATLDRPWLGSIFFLALHDGALDADEIRTLFQVGVPHDPTAYLEALGRREPPIALYDFQGGGPSVEDRSPVAPPLPLEITQPENTHWLPKGGLELTAPTALRSTAAPAKIYDRFAETQAFTVVTWIEPRNNIQGGPARIVSASKDPFRRNFTLGQARANLHFRVRNSLSGQNGVHRNLVTRGLGLQARLMHVVATYDDGAECLYLDGKLVARLPAVEPTAFGAGLLNLDPSRPWHRGLLLILFVAPLAGLWTLPRRAPEGCALSP